MIDLHMHSRYISGIGIDCVYKGLNLHVPGYGINERSADFSSSLRAGARLSK